MSETMSIGEVAERSGVAASALRYYEDRGLITPERTTAAHRRYHRPVLRRVAFIVFAQRVGLTLEEIGRGAGQAARRPRSATARLGQAVGHVVRAHRRADRRAGAAEGRADRVHRLRLPVAGAVQARQPGRQRGQHRQRAALLGGRTAPRGLIDPVHELGGEPAVRVGDRALSYGELRGAAAAVAADLGGARRVAVWAEPTLETCVAVTAACAAGIELVPLNPRLGTAELAHVLGDSRPEVVVGGPDGLAVDVDRRAPELPHPARDPEDIALIVYTSGTTGPPKGARLSRRAIASNLDALAAAWEWSAADTLAHALPLFHVHGLVLGLLGPLRAGGALHHLGRFDPVALAGALEGGATMAFGVPTMYHRLAEAGDRVAPGLRAARLLVSGSAPLPAPDFAAIEQLSGQRIAERYGLTETLIVTAVGAGDERRPGHVGRPLPGVELELVAEEGDDQMGEVAVRGPSLFSGYVGGPEPGDRFMTGDLATRAPDGQLRIVGRRSQDLIKTAGYKVGAGEVEVALLDHPGVAEAAVTAEPDPDLGQRIVAWVVPRDGGAAPDGLADHVAARLAPHKRPREVRVLDELPRNAMGKVVKSRLGA